MNTSEFRLMIQTLYGTSAQSKLARATGLSTRTIRRYASGERPIPAWMGLLLTHWMGLLLTQQLKDLEESK